MDLTLYKKMVGENTSMTQAYISDSITHVNDMFSKSPSYREIVLDGVETDCIMSYKKKSTALELLFRPQTLISKGTYTTIGVDTYIISDFIPNEVYPKAVAELCNSELKWKDDLGNVYSHRCVVKATRFSETDERQAYISQSELVVLTQYNDETKTILPLQRFVFGNNVYEVTTIDSVTNVYNEIGIIEFIVKFTSASTTDDFDNKVSDTSGDSGWGDWS